MKERPEDFKKTKRAVFIQCVGSREPQRPYCSKLCCTHSVESAIDLKKLNPEMEIIILYRDIRTYGFREVLYQKAREMGILFIRYDLEAKPQVKVGKDELEISIVDPILEREVILPADLLVLASAILPNEVKEVAEKFKIPQNAEGFFLEAHMKLRPVDFGSDGFFLCGLAHYPKPIDEGHRPGPGGGGQGVDPPGQRRHYGGRSGGRRGSGETLRRLSDLRADLPFSSASSSARKRLQKLMSTTCQGCGVCVSECPGKAIRLQHFTDNQLNAKVDALLWREVGGIEAA